MGLPDAAVLRLDHLVATAQVEGRVPALVAGVVRDGALVWSGAAGSVGASAPDDDTQFRMGSITKTFVAVSILRLRDAGRLDLADRFEEHVAGTPFGSVTIEQLLTHTAGLQAETPGPWWERTPGGTWDELVAAGVGQRFRAGRRFHYTNVGYAALGHLLEVVEHRPWFEVVRDDLLVPLGMTRTTLRPSGRAAQGWAVHPVADLVLREPEHDAGAMAPAGQLWSTVADLGRWAAFLAGRTEGVLSADTVAEMLEPHMVHEEVGAPWTGAHGLGWEVWNVDGVRYAGHGGSMPGFLAGLRVNLATGDGVVTLLNTTSTPVGRSLMTDLHATLLEAAPKAPTPWVGQGEAVGLDLVGPWHWGPAPVVASLRQGRLVLGEPGERRGSRFDPVGPDEWIGLDGYYTGEPLRVVRDAHGAVSHLDLASFRFTREPYDPARDIPGGVDEAGWH